MTSLDISDEGNRVVLVRKEWANEVADETIINKRKEDLNYLRNFMDPYGEIDEVHFYFPHQNGFMIRIPVDFTAETWIAFCDMLAEK